MNYRRSQNHSSVVFTGPVSILIETLVSDLVVNKNTQLTNIATDFTPRDGFESLAYTALFLLRGSLPW
ncbi:hypothetical protein M422DRAFT_176680 [Sphaerobolus stellatus SS14]|uniref:Uncharacterized protein n=1 Tax=Sphaerobolus stellatus (strain SS14) TaxID=990650 RepID=A0A0C9U5Z8_SPHS4|nr:hypothetical protein M422DRAFT_176680 [Sphaerobolus stellatus SS14]